MNIFLTLVRYTILPIICLLFCASCTDNKPVDREAIKKEMKTREIKRMTASEIQLEGERIGQVLLALPSDSIADFQELYQLQFDTLFWEQPQVDSTFNAILEVYTFAKEENLPMPSGIQGTDQKNLYFCNPMLSDTDTTGVLVTTIPRKYLIINYED